MVWDLGQCTTFALADSAVKKVRAQRYKLTSH
jgi:hypothetical protein